MHSTFEWDEDKAAENLPVFGDPFLLTFPDPTHSRSEERYVNIGCSSKGRVLVVVHTERGQNVRLINARRATANERKAYEEGSL